MRANLDFVPNRCQFLQSHRFNEVTKSSWPCISAAGFASHPRANVFGILDANVSGRHYWHMPLPSLMPAVTALVTASFPFTTRDILCLCDSRFNSELPYRLMQGGDRYRFCAMKVRRLPHENRVLGKDMIGDFFTKPLQGSLFRKFWALILNTNE